MDHLCSINTGQTIGIMSNSSSHIYARQISKNAQRKGLGTSCYIKSIIIYWCQWTSQYMYILVSNWTVFLLAFGLAFSIWYLNSVSVHRHSSLDFFDWSDQPADFSAILKWPLPPWIVSLFARIYTYRQIICLDVISTKVCGSEWTTTIICLVRGSVYLPVFIHRWSIGHTIFVLSPSSPKMDDLWDQPIIIICEFVYSCDFSLSQQQQQ